MISQRSNVHIDTALTKLSLAYRNEDYIAEKIAPVVQVQKDSGKVFSYGMDNLRIVNTYRSIGGKPNVVETTVSSADHYYLEDHVLGEFIPEEVYENADAPLSPRMDVTKALADRLWVDKEKALADVLTSSTYITNYETLSGTSQFSDYDNSTPVDDIKDAIASVRAASGKTPNTMIIAWDVLNTLLYHPDIKDFFPGAPAITRDMLQDSLKRIFNLKNLYVGSAQYNSANKGGTDTLADIWTKDMLVAYIEDNPSLMSRSLAFTYQRKAPRYVQRVANGSDLETTQRKSDYIQISDKYDQVLVDANCAYLLEAAIA